MKKIWGKTIPAFLLAIGMLVSLIPAAGAVKADLSVAVNAGEEVAVSRSDFRNLFRSESNGSFYYLEFTDVEGMDEIGGFVASGFYGDTYSLNEEALKNTRFYYYSSDVSSGRDYSLFGLAFATRKGAPSGV